MRLHAPKFEKSLRRGVREAVRSSKELKRQARANRLRKSIDNWMVFRWVISIILFFAVRYVWIKTGHTAAALAVISLWAFMFVFIHAQRLLVSLYAASDAQALMMLPIPDDKIFQWQIQKAVRGTFWSLLDFLAGFAVLVYYQSTPALWWAWFPAALLTWLVVVALTALAVAYLPQFPYRLASGMLMIAVLGIFFGRKLVADPLIQLIDTSAPTLNLILPTGWPGSVLQFLTEHKWSWLTLLLPVGALIATVKISWARLQTGYQYSELVIPEAPDLVPDADLETMLARGEEDMPMRVGPTAIEEIIQSRTFLQTPSWPDQSWLENRLWHWFSPREQALSEFVFPDGLAILRPWGKVLRNFGITCALALAGRWLHPSVGMGLLGFGLFVTLCQVVARFFTAGRAFEPIANSGVNVPRYASYGIGFSELSRFLLKCAAVQSPFMILFAVAASVLVFFMSERGIVNGVVFGLKAAGLLFASRFIVLLMSFSSGSNDTNRVRLWSLVVLLTLLTGGLAFVGFGAASLFVTHPQIAWFFWGLAWVDALVLFVLYRWFYHTNGFDLVSIPQA